MGSGERAISRTILPFVLVLGLFLSGCISEGGDEARYCNLALALNRKAEGAFAELPQNASPEQISKAMKYFRSIAAKELSEIERVAPRKIASDIKSIIAAQRTAAAGDLSALERMNQQIGKIRKYELKECRRDLKPLR
jgi:hypothetical protein